MKRGITLDSASLLKGTGCASNRISKKIFLIISFIMTVNGLFSQSLIEKAGGVKTAFTIINSSNEISVLAQAIIKRAFHDSDFYSHFDGGYGFGYAAQSFHLEFLTTSDLHETHKFRKGAKKRYYQIALIDKDDNTLLTSEMGYDKIKRYTNGADLVTYSINLNEIPMILLDKTKKIAIERIITYRK